MYCTFATQASRSLGNLVSSVTTISGALEGVFYGGWLWHSWSDFSQACQNDSNVSKSQHVVSRRVEFFLRGSSLVSSFAMVLGWLNQIRVIALGALVPFVDALGFFLTASVSLVRFFCEAREIVVVGFPVNQDRWSKGEKFFKMVFHLMMAAWSISMVVSTISLGVLAYSSVSHGLAVLMGGSFVVYCFLFIVNRERLEKNKLSSAVSGFNSIVSP